MQKLLCSLTVATLSLFVSNVQAACPVGMESRLHAGYFNGMMTSLDRALGNFEALQTSLNSTLRAPGHDVQWGLHYNQDEATLDQAEQVLTQKLEDDGFFESMKATFTLLNSGAASISLDSLPFDAETNEALEQGLIQWLQENIASVESVIEASLHPYTNDADLESMISNLHELIKTECRKVLMLPHSQGNFYANEAWERLYQMNVDRYRIDQFKLIGIVSLGSPAQQVGSPLASGLDTSNIRAVVLHEDDIVVTIIDGVGLGTLPATTGADDADITAHSLIDTYLRSPEVSEQIRSQVTSVIANLEPWTLSLDSVGSSAIAGAGHNGFNEILDVEFSGDGSVYRYRSVPTSAYEGLLQADSAGAYFNMHIRNAYETTRLSP